MEDFFSNSAHYEFHRVTYDYVTRKSNRIHGWSLIMHVCLASFIYVKPAMAKV